MTVRPEAPRDHTAVRALNRAAFGRDAEGKLVEALRAHRGAISLVAADDDGVVGHILFTPVEIVARNGLRPLGAAAVHVAGLGPMAVLPDHQRQGIGSRLVREGLARCRDAGYGAVVVLGHPAYYPRFGFVPASRHGLRFEASVPDEAFMARELAPDALSGTGTGGVVKYLPAFSLV